MKYWKRNAVIVTLVVLVCVAVLLNWRYNAVEETAVSEDYVSFEDTGLLLGEAEEVAGPAADGAQGDREENTAVDEAEVYGADDDYFSTARLTRQQSRDAALALLEDALAAESITQEVVDDTSDAMEAMAQMTMAETTIESLVIARGFEDCVAFASDDSISLVVSEPADGFTVSDIAKITDVVTGELGYTAEQIKIVGV